MVHYQFQMKNFKIKKMKTLDLILENNNIELSENKALKNFMSGILHGITSNNIAGLKAVNPTLADDFVKIVTSKEIKGVNNADELVNLLKSQKLAPQAMSDLMVGALKTKGISPFFVEKVVKMWVDDPRFIKAWATDGKSLTKQALIKKGYSSIAADEIIKYSKNSKKFQDALKGVKPTGVKPTGVKPTNSKSLIDKIKSLINSGHAKNVTKPGSKVKRFIISKTLLGVVLGVAGGVLVLRNNLGGEDVELTDENGNPINENNQWLPCIQNLIKNKKGKIVKLNDGSFGVSVTDSTYPKGITFYSNGRVIDGATGKKGSYKCKDGKTQISEQIDNELSNDVETMIDLLDFPVTYNDLIEAGKLLKKYVDNGRGKEFLSLYQQSGLGGGDINKTIDYIYTVNAKSVQAKNYLKSLVSQIESGKSGNTSTGGGSLDDVLITWDGDKKGGGVASSPKNSIYHNCESKNFPFEFGCINSTYIGAIQRCLGVTPTKGYFGPKTMKSLKDNGFDMSGRKITKEIYDAVIENCNSESSGGRKLEKLTTSPIEKKDLTGKSPTVTAKEIPTNMQSPEEFYASVYNADLLFNDGGRIKYKGEQLSPENLQKLDTALSKKGYQRIKQLDKSYGEKYVWEKQ